MNIPDPSFPEPRHERSDGALHELSDQQLLDLIAEMNARLEHLHTEIARRMQTHSQQKLEAAQHAEIARLVEHLEQAKVDWSKVWEFFRDTISETRDRDPWGASTAYKAYAPDDAGEQGRRRQ